MERSTPSLDTKKIRGIIRPQIEKLIKKTKPHCFMIGSNTLVVKENNSFRVHQFGGWSLQNPSFAAIVKIERKWQKTKKTKASKTRLTEYDAYVILSSHQCRSPYEPDYSEFAGDGVYLLNLDAGKMVDREIFCHQFEDLNIVKIELEKKKLAEKRAVKEKEIYTAYEDLEKNVLRLMETKTETKRDENYNYGKSRCEYDKRMGKLHFFIGHDNQKIDAMPSFYDWFLQRRNNLKALFKRKIWDDNIIVDIYTFTHKGKKWSWNRGFSGENEIMEFIK